MNKFMIYGIIFILVGVIYSPGLIGGKVFLYVNNSDDLPNIIWSNTYGGSAYSVQQTSDNGYILSGESGGDALLIKTNEIGNVEWIKNFGGSWTDFAQYAIECSDGGFLCTGGDGYTTHSQKEAFLIRTDEYGNELWYKTFRRHDRNGQSWGMCAIEVSDGYVILLTDAGWGADFDSDAWLIKTDKNGNEIWNKTYGGESGDVGGCLIQTKEGGFVITGYTYSFDMGGGDAWLLKTDSEGNKVWNKSYGGYYYDTGEDVIQTEDGGYMIAGRYTPAYQGWGEVGLFKTDSSGNLEWIRYYGGTDNDFGNSLARSDDGGYVIVGIRHSGLPDFTGWILKTDGNGNKIWDEIIGGRPYKIINSNDGNYVIAGFKSGAWLMKVEDFENNLPTKPTQKYDNIWQQLKVVSIDPDGDRIRYGISWYNNKVVDEWTDYYDSGEEGTINCFGKEKPASVIAEDDHGGQSEWVMAKSKVKPFNPLFQLLQKFIDHFPILKYIFQFM